MEECMGILCLRLLSVARAVSFFSRREDSSSCEQCLRVLRAPKSLNTEFTETFRVLRVKA